MVKRLARILSVHFEACFFASFWINASVLAVLAGRAPLGAIGLLTVAPVLVLYARSRRS